MKDILIYDMAADTGSSSITAFATPDDVGNYFEVQDAKGNMWCGLVYDDCIALLRRSDLPMVVMEY